MTNHYSYSFSCDENDGTVLYIFKATGTDYEENVINSLFGSKANDALDIINKLESNDETGLLNDFLAKYDY